MDYKPLDLIDATAKPLRERIKALEKVAAAAKAVVDASPPGTHWEGCEKDHKICALAKALRELEEE